MINIRTLKKLNNDDGITLKNGVKVEFKTGYQVATEGLETTDIKEAMKMVKAYNGNCGVWFYNGIYYVDKCHRVTTKKDALALGRECSQISIFRWAKKDLIFC